MSRFIKNFIKYKPLLFELVKKDIKIKYRKSVLGFFWSLLNPLFMMIIISVVFTNIFKFSVENYPIYVLSGQLIFNFFNEATSVGLQAIIGNDMLLKKIYIPKYLFVLTQSISSLINLLASFTALFIVMVVLGVDLHYISFLFFVPLVLLYIFSYGVSLFLAAIAVKFRDIIYLWGVITTGLFYMTPVIYPLSLMDGKKIELLVKLNPLTNYLTMFRDVMINNQIFSLRSLGIALVETFIVLFVGLFVFYKKQDTFILDL